MRISNLAILLLSASSIFAATDKRREKQTKASMKEELGCELKGTLAECIELNRQLANLQIKLSSIEKRLLNKGEDLLEGGPSFKKDHAELSKALDLITETHSTVSTLVAKLDKDVCFGGA